MDTLAGLQPGIYLTNHAAARITGVRIEELDASGRPMGSAPGSYGRPMLVRALGDGEQLLSIDGYARTSRFQAIATFANGDEVAYRSGTTIAASSEGALSLEGPAGDRYKLFVRNESGRVLLSIYNAIDLTNWMTALPNERELWQMSIPGTHDSCALYGGPAAQCQTKSLEEQLDRGIRFIDIRCRHIENVFTIHHESIYQHINFGTGVRDVCLKFLREHPGECIVMSVKEEYPPPTDCTRSFEETFTWYVEGNQSCWYLADTIPTLGEARGKIVLFRRFTATASVLGINASEWKNNATFEIENAANLRIQDEYQVPTVCDVKEKWEKIKRLLDGAAGASGERWFINFMSGSSSGAYPDAVAIGSGLYPGENPRLWDYFNSTTTGKTGTVLMDFPESPNAGLVEKGNPP